MVLFRHLLPQPARLPFNRLHPFVKENPGVVEEQEKRIIIVFH
jgi:hypothetical protein